MVDSMAKHTLLEGYNAKKKSDWWEPDSPAGRYLDAIDQGLPKRLAARSAGVSVSAVLKWRIAFDAIDQSAPKLKVSERMIVRFFRSVADAEARLARDLVSAWKEQATAGDWRAAKELLARRFPDDMGDPASRVELTGAGGGPVAVVSDPDLADLVATAKARAMSEGE